MKIYLIGSLRNAEVPVVAGKLRQKTGHDIFDNWHAAGPEADDYWREYEKARGHTYHQALASPEAKSVFHFDKHNLDDSSGAVLLYPAGKSAHLELGYIIGQGKPGWILLDGEPERFDVMLNFATEVFTDVDSLSEAINEFTLKQAKERFRHIQEKCIYGPLFDNVSKELSFVR